MKIPNHLTVGGHLYTVIENYKFKEREDLAGQVDHTALEIRLAGIDSIGVIKRSKIECNFIHELLHCVDNTYNANKLEEDDVVRLCEGLYQVLEVNNLLKG